MVGEDVTLTAKSKVDFARMPPCQNSLVPHIQRVNYRVANYKRANQPIVIKPKPHDPGQGWIKTEQGCLEPVWSCGPILPLSLIDLMDSPTIEEENEEDEDEMDIDYDEMLQYIDDDNDDDI